MVDQNSIFGGMLTTLGAAKKTNCDALGIPWEPRYMLIGDANGTDPVPSPAQTKLINQRYRAQLNRLYVSPTDDNVLIAELVLPPDVGGWWIRELALEDKDGVFSAVANVAPSYKPLLAQGSGRNQVVRMHVITSGTSNIQLKIDPSVVLATRGYVDDMFSGLLPPNKITGTYTKVTVNDRGVFVAGSNPTTLAGFGIKDTYTKTEIESMIAQASALPVGTMVGFPVNKVAPGFLEIDGSVQSIALYPDLATFLGGAFNLGNEGVGNFRLPESRAEFLRGWDHGRGVDAGRAIGTYQKGSLLYGNDDNGAEIHGLNGINANRAGLGWDLPVMADYSGSGAYTASGVAVPGTSLFAQAHYGVARPRNLAVMWCIKAWNAPINQGNIDIAALASLATQATEVKLGTAKIATQALTDAGIDDGTIVTPKKLRAGFLSSFTANGYLAFPSWLGGLVIQWGSLSVAGTATVPLPMAWPTGKCFGVWGAGQTGIDGSTGGSAWVESGVVSSSQIFLKVVTSSSSGNAQGNRGVSWLAIGK